MIFEFELASTQSLRQICGENCLLVEENLSSNLFVMHVRTVILWTVACQAPLSMELTRQEYWSVLPFPPPGGLLTQGSNPCFLHLLHWQADPIPPSHLRSQTTVISLF